MRHLLGVFSDLLAHQACLLCNGIQSTRYRVHSVVLFSNHHLFIGGKEVLSPWRKRKIYYKRTVPAVLVVPKPLGDRPHIGLRMVNRGQRVE